MSSFQLTPCVLSCVAFVHILDSCHDKLSPRARKCVFLGYSKTHKGYWYYNVEPRRYFVSPFSSYNCLVIISLYVKTGHLLFHLQLFPCQLLLTFRFIGDHPKICLLFLIAQIPRLHRLRSRFLPYPLLPLTIYLLLYDEVNELLLNILFLTL